MSTIFLIQKFLTIFIVVTHYNNLLQFSRPQHSFFNVLSTFLQIATSYVFEILTLAYLTLFQSSVSDCSYVNFSISSQDVLFYSTIFNKRYIYKTIKICDKQNVYHNQFFSVIYTWRLFCKRT